MTNEEAIRRLEYISSHAVHTIEEESFIMSIDDGIAIKMAIKALEQQPCEDVVSREAVHSLMAMLLSDYLHDEDREKIELIDAEIAELPSVTPEEKTGKWIKTQSGDDMFPEIIVCSKCNNENSHLDFNEHAEPIGKVFIKSKYCPNCGARMYDEADRGDDNG